MPFEDDTATLPRDPDPTRPDLLEALARAREDLRREREARGLLETLLAGAPVGLALLDRELRFVQANPALCSLLEAPRHASPGEWIGRSLRAVAPPFAPLLEPLLLLALERGQPIVEHEVAGEFARDGGYFRLRGQASATPPQAGAAPEQRHHWMVSCFPARAGDGEIRGVGLAIAEITERRRVEAELALQGSFDALSRLPNRAAFMARLERALDQARRAGTAVALLLVDLDNFKVINDSLGHSAGDALIVAVAERIRACTRPQDTLARLGGDEFLLLLEGLTDPTLAINIAERIAAQLQGPIPLSSHRRSVEEVFTTASIGIAFSSPATARPEDLVRDADIAMYQAKANGKASYVVFDRGMETRAAERLELETELHRALEQRQFRICYQPIVHLAMGQIEQVEALLRWEHPRHGLVAPDRFVPLLEETGLIVPVGRWLLEAACRQAALWEGRFPSRPPRRLAVNLAPRQLNATLPADLAGILARTGLDPTRLELEITESAMVGSHRERLDCLHRLKALGVRLALDDFGTGYSSMAYLQTLPLDTVKIDRSFVCRLGERAKEEAIVRAIVAMARTLGLEVIAEGIETAGQAAALRAIGCEHGQGYLYARPLAAEAFAALLARAAAGSDPFEYLKPAAFGP